MIEEQAYALGGDIPDDMPDPAAERLAAYLDTQDAATDWTPGGDGYALSYDEWLAEQAHTGKPGGDFAAYLASIARDPIVAMLARKWATEDNGAGDVPAEEFSGDVPF